MIEKVVRRKFQEFIFVTMVLMMALPVFWANFIEASENNDRRELSRSHISKEYVRDARSMPPPPLLRSIPCHLGEEVPVGACVLPREGVQAQCLPTFMIIGAQKCGTSALRDRLSEHPWLESGNDDKEIHYFDKLMGSTDFGGDLKLSESHPKQAAELSLSNLAQIEAAKDHCPSYVYLSNFRGPSITFDKTPSYIRNNAAMRLIKQWFPKMKIIISLRNPTDRAYSGFCHNSRHQRYLMFNLTSYRKAFGADPPDGVQSVVMHRRDANILQRVHGEIITECTSDYFAIHYQSLRKGVLDMHNRFSMWHSMYLQQVEVALQTFGPENVHIILQERMFEDTIGTLYDVEDFIGVKHFKYDEEAPAQHVHHDEPLKDDIRGVMDAHFRPHNIKLGDLLLRLYNITLPAKWAV